LPLDPQVMLLFFYAYLGIGVGFYTFIDFIVTSNTDPSKQLLRDIWQASRAKILIYMIFGWLYFIIQAILLLITPDKKL
jgi:hypothetical protein